MKKIQQMNHKIQQQQLVMIYQIIKQLVKKLNHQKKQPLIILIKMICIIIEKLKN